MDIRPIRNEEDYTKALTEIAQFFENEPEIGSPAADHFDVLAALIAAYERDHWPVEPPDAVDAIRWTMELRHYTQKDLAQLLGSNTLRWVLPAGITLLAIIDLYGVHAYMLPYYTGLTAHVGERVPALKLSGFPVAAIFARLATLGPAWLSLGILELAWLGYLLATFSLAGVAWRLGAKVRRNA